MKTHAFIITLTAFTQLVTAQNPFGMQLRPPPKSISEVSAPVLIGQQTPSQECSVITRHDGTLEVYFITKPAGDSISLMRSKDGGLTWSAAEVAFVLPGKAHFGIQAVEAADGSVQIVFHLLGEGPGGYRGRLYEVYHTHTTKDGTWTKPHRVVPGYVGSIRGFVQLKSGRLVLGVGVAVPERAKESESGPDLGWNDTVVYYSDDATHWQKSPDILNFELAGKNTTRYGAIEPTLVQLSDGRVWMLIRDRGGRLYESFSADGSRWSKPQHSRFISSDSPAELLRLKDGRILILWNPCQFWTNPRSYAMGGRDVLCAAISTDDAKTWHGYREILHETDQVSRGDRGTAYASATETADGKIFVSAGQGEHKRAMLLFDPQWLMEKRFTDDLTRGPIAWTQYGDTGLTTSADKQHLILPLKAAGIGGAVLNFPALAQGTLSLRLWLPAETSEITLGLNDHFNRIDDLKAADHLVFRADLRTLPRDAWQDIHLTWTDTELTLTLNGQPHATLKPQRPAISPMSYFRIESRSDKNTGVIKISSVTTAP
jgi:hypothetical protein